MNKELEVLEDWLEGKINEDEISISDLEYLKKLKSAIIELKQIKEASPSEVSQGLKQLNNYEEWCKKYGLPQFDFEPIKQMLLSKQVEVSNSKALMCLEVMNNNLQFSDDWSYSPSEQEEDYNTIKQALIKAQEQEKVLEIIIKKCIYSGNLINVKIAEDYNDYLSLFEDRVEKQYLLTEEEFNLIKRYFDER